MSSMRLPGYFNSIYPFWHQKMFWIWQTFSSLFQEEVRPQDTVSVIGGVAGGSKHGRKAAWKFIKDNWEELYNRYQGGFLISRLIKVGGNFCSEQLIRDIIKIPMIHQTCRLWSLLFKSLLKQLLVLLKGFSNSSCTLQNKLKSEENGMTCFYGK